MGAGEAPVRTVLRTLTAVSVLLYESGLTALLDLPTGPVARNVTAKAEQVAELARQNVQSTFQTRTGNLQQSIGVFPNVTPDGLEYEVGTDGAPYGLILELGGEPHEIRARNFRILISEPGHPDPLLRPHVEVAHPGNRPMPWLRPALEAVFSGG